MRFDLLTREIIHDNLSGSQDLTKKAGLLILQLLRDREHPSPEALRRDLLKVGSRLLHAQPAMASLLNLFNTILFTLNDAPNGPAAVREVRSATVAFIREMNEHNKALSNHLFRRLRTKNTILTYSGSRSVRESLVHCWKKGKRFSVVCCESRPAGEGTLLARRLVAEGIPTSLTTDALALSLLTASHRSKGRVNMTLVGADSVSPRGLTNKVGTHPLALVANHSSVPFYALAGSEKFLPSNFPMEAAIHSSPAEEILTDPPKRLKIINRTFDITPLSHLTGVITEKGLLSPREIQIQLKQVHFHPGLMATLKKVISPK